MRPTVLHKIEKHYNTSICRKMSPHSYRLTGMWVNIKYAETNIGILPSKKLSLSAIKIRRVI